MGADLALTHHRLLARMDVFDRVFHGDDVARRARVEDVDDGRKRRGLAVACRPGDHHKPLMMMCGALYLRRQPEGSEGRDRGGDTTETRLQAGALPGDVDAKSTRGMLEGKVARSLIVE